MTSDATFRCKAVRSPRGATVTEIDWGDGHKGILPHEILRGYCPCAGCQGHEGSIRFIYPTSHNQTELDTIEAVGNYALQLRWFDGHRSGIYSFKYLRALCQCPECRPGESSALRGELPRS